LDLLAALSSIVDNSGDYLNQAAGSWLTTLPESGRTGAGLRQNISLPRQASTASDKAQV